jgi:peptidoglycan hydrolase CwlO-like protein
VRRAVFVVASAALLLVVPIAGHAVAEGSAGDGASAQDALEAARANATEAAAQLDAAQNEKASLQSQIAQAQSDIQSLHARADDLRALVRQRAVRMYVYRPDVSLNAVVNTSSAVDVRRAAHMTATVGDHDQSIANKLQDTVRELEQRTTDMQARQAELDQTIASLVELRDQFDNRIERAVTASERVSAVDPAAAAVVGAPPSGDAVWATFRECTFSHESGGDYSIVSPDGVYYGAWQFDISTWNSVAARIGRNDLVGVLPSQASPADQDAVAYALWLDRGNQPWGGRC